MNNSSNSAAKAIVSAWLLAGTLDITAAIIQTYIMGGKPVMMFRYIARGLVGGSAGLYDIMPVMGLILHYLIAFIFTIIFFYLCPRISILRKDKIVAGLLYGVFVWFVMNWIIVPLSFIRHFPSRIGPALLAMVILMVCIGLPISIIINNYYSRKTAR